MTKKYIPERIHVDCSKLGCSTEDFCEDIKRQTSDLQIQGWKEIVIDLWGYPGEGELVFNAKRPETDDEYKRRIDAEEIKKKAEADRLELERKNEEEKLAKEKELYLSLKQKFEPNQDS
jgi:hypothetical protein